MSFKMFPTVKVSYPMKTTPCNQTFPVLQYLEQKKGVANNYVYEL